jgi:hypothetical protein
MLLLPLQSLLFVSHFVIIYHEDLAPGRRVCHQISHLLHRHQLDLIRRLNGPDASSPFIGGPAIRGKTFLDSCAGRSFGSPVTLRHGGEDGLYELLSNVCICTFECKEHKHLFLSHSPKPPLTCVSEDSGAPPEMRSRTFASPIFLLTVVIILVSRQEHIPQPAVPIFLRRATAPMKMDPTKPVRANVRLYVCVCVCVLM